MQPRAFIVALIFMLLPCAADAAGRYAGNWKRTSLRLTVKIESWGADCGPEPRSYGSGQEVETSVVAQGRHLVFSTGNLRTDRCMSPNPRLQSVSESIGGGSWRRVCQTPSSDSRSERVEYSLTAKGTDRLEYRALSRFDWKLKGDHCVANLEETRVFVRVVEGDGKPAAAKKPPQAEKPPPPEKPAKPPEEDPEGVDCAVHGPARRITVSPREARIGPGERVCFTAHGLDDGGCRFPVNAAWIVIQDGQEVGGLLSRGGCFSAGATAADAEGEYEVVARFEGRRASARVVVAFPDLGDLLAARLRPLAGDQEDAGMATADPPATLPSIAPQPVAAPPSPDRGGKTVLLAVAIGAIVAASTALLVIVLIIRRRGRRVLDDEDEDAWSEPLVSTGHPHAPRKDLPPSSLPPEPLSPSAEEALACPKCGARFPAGAKFCPHDGSGLVAAVAEPAQQDEDTPGMICPACHRPYEQGSRFCPHDKEALIPYPVWRERQRDL